MGRARCKTQTYFSFLGETLAEKNILYVVLVYYDPDCKV